MPYPCVWVEETGSVLLRLRRYVMRSECPGGGWHNATSEPVARRHAKKTEEGAFAIYPRRGYGKNHPAWPSACSKCGEPFGDAGIRMIEQEPIYFSPETGQEWPRGQLPIGAMYDATWMPDDWRGADGISLHVILPPGGSPVDEWNVDAPASNGRWTRTGDPTAIPPTVTAQPSIKSPNYHGFLVLHEGRSALTDPV